MGQMGYDAVNITPKNLVFGEPFLLENGKKHNIPFLSPANHKKAALKNVPEFRLINNIAVIGLTVPDEYYLGNKEIDIKSLYGTVKTVLAEIPDTIDFVICLSHIGLQNTRRLAMENNGIDLYLAGKTGRATETIEKAGDSYIFAVSDEGKYAGYITVDIDKETSIPVAAGSRIFKLDSSFKDHPRMSGIVDKYKNGLKDFWADEVLKEITTPVYSSAKSCAECHESEYEKWQNTTHSFALQTLKQKKSDYDPECLTCHTTGFQQYNGFWNYERTPKMGDVQCEACHGGGIKHINMADGIKSGRDFPPLELSVCTRCHTERQSPDFSFHEAWKIIEH